MASTVKQVQIKATADLRGFEDAAKALKDLQRAVAPADAALEKVRQEIIDFAAANKRSEASIQAQLNAFQKLRQQAEIGGKVYNELGRDIDKLKQIATGSTNSIDQLTKSFGDAARTLGSKSLWQQQAKELAAFNKQAGETGRALRELAPNLDKKFDDTRRSIEAASKSISELKNNASNIGTLFQGPQKGGGVFEFGRKGLRDVQAYAELVKRLKEQTETATGKVARLSEGVFALGAASAGIGGITSALGGVSGALEAVSNFGAKFASSFAGLGSSLPTRLAPVKAALNEITLLLNQPANGIANWAESLSRVQSTLTTANAPLEAFTNAISAIGPEGALVAGALAASFAGIQDVITRSFRAGEKEASQALQGITDETQRLLEKLALLSEAFRGAASMNELRGLLAGANARFNETPAGTDASRRAANSIANAESRIKAEGMAQAEVLEAARQRYRGTTESVDALSERLAYLQSAMKLVDQSTAEGNAEFAQFAGEAEQVKRRIDQLSQSYRTVADAIRDAARAQGEYANQSTVANYFNRAAARRQEEIAQAAREALARPQTPLLPAGDTSKPAIRGGARLLSSFEVAGTSSEIGAAMGSLSSALDKSAASLNRAEGELNDLQREIGETLRSVGPLADGLERLRKGDVVDPQSINALRMRREQIDKERNSVKMLSDDYNRLTRQLAKVDRQIERTQPGGLRGKAGYIGQGIGAAASAGIFGGPEGLLGGIGGGLIGLAMGGPAGFAAGAFTGSSIGAYAGMGRQQVGGFTTYAADISKLEIALKGVTKTQQEFQRALAASASVTRDFNVPQLEATRGMTQLSAAVIGAGGKVADAEVVFRNVTAAIKASGGTSEDVQGALTALGQIFSKGKVSAEELQGQLGERLPGAVTMFAKATGRTLPQLQKDLEQGVVGLADLMKFVVSDQGLGQFEQRAKDVASSSADAGARLTATFNDTKRAIGDALLPLGAQIQDSLSQALKDATPALVDFSKALGSAVKLVTDNAGAIAAAGKAILEVSLVIGGGLGFVKAAQGITFVAKAIADLGGILGVVRLAASTLGATLAAIPGIGWIGAAIVGLGLLTKAVYDNNDTFRNWVDNIGGVIADDFKAALQDMKSEAQKVFDFIGDLLPDYKEKSDKAVEGVEVGWDSAFKAIADGATEMSLAIQNAFAGLFDRLPPWARKILIDNAGGTSAGLAFKIANYFQGASRRAVERGQAQDAAKSGYYGRYGAPESQVSIKTDFDGLTEWEKLQEKERKDKKAAAAAKEANEEQQRQEALAKNRIALDDAVHRNAMDLIRQRYEYEQELTNKQRDNWVKAQSNAARGFAQIASSLLGAFDDQTAKVRQLEQAVQDAAQQLKSAQALAAVTVGGSLQGARSGVTGNSVAGFPITDRPGYSAWRGRMHQGYDIGTPSGTPLSFTMGGRVLSATTLQGYGKVLEVELENGVVAFAAHLNEVLAQVGQQFTAGMVLAKTGNTGVGTGPHLHMEGKKGGDPGAALPYLMLGGKAAGGNAAAGRRDIAAEGAAEVAQKNWEAAKLALAEYQAQLGKMNPEVAKGAVLDATQGIRDQIEALEDQNWELKMRQKLLDDGVRPEFADAQVRISQEFRNVTESVRAGNEQLEELKKKGLENTEQYKALQKVIESLVLLFPDLKKKIEEVASAQAAANDKAKTFDAQFKDVTRAAYADAMNLGKNFGQTFINAIDGMTNALVEFTMTGKLNFADLARSIIADINRIILRWLVFQAIKGVLNAVSPGLGSSIFKLEANGDAFARNGIVPFASGGTFTNSVVAKPTLFKFAQGGAMRTGIMGEAGPEAIIPLKRGRDGKLGVASGGSGAPVTVNVSVDASGSQVQGNAGQGEALGRAVASAVQQELIRQKRPGGLLAA